MTKAMLVADADLAANTRGHALTWVDQDARRALGTCSCESWVQVDTRPDANGIDIGGPAVAVNHENQIKLNDHARA